MKTGKGRRCGAAIFRGEVGEEVRGLHGTEADDTMKNGAVAGEAEGGS
jgi:hypothetical protein